MNVSMITPKMQAKILTKQLSQVAKEYKVPVNTFSKIDKSLKKEMAAPNFNMTKFREKIMDFAEKMALGLKL